MRSHPKTDTPADAAAGDWDLLFCAVTERLRRVVTSPGGGTPNRVRADVLECVAALEQLRIWLAAEMMHTPALRPERSHSRDHLAIVHALLDREV